MSPLILVFAASFAFQAQNPLQQALTLTRQGHYSAARNALKNSAAPDEPAQQIAFHRLKAAIASGLREFPAAAAEMHLALQFSPEDSNLLLATAAAELKANQLSDALAHAHSAGDTPTASALIGDIEERRGNAPTAVEAYRHAVDLAPAIEQYRIALASELIQHQAFGPAMEVSEQARQTFPHSAKLLVLLGIAHYAAGDTEQAIDLLTDAATLEPKLTAPYMCLSQIVLQSSAAPPEKVLNSLCQWNTTVCAALQLRQARETSNEALALRAITQLKKASPLDPIAHCALGRSYEWRHQLAIARRELETCVTQDGSPQNHYVLALLYQRMGESLLARKQLALRESMLRHMSEETTAGLSVLQTFNASLTNKP